MSLRGQVAIVTGAAQGLGRSIAQAYAAEGLRVALMDVQADKLAGVTEQLKAEGGDCTAFPVDLADAAATERAINAALAHYGTPRVLVHNAAILIERPFTDYDLPLWTMELNIILQAAFILTRAVWDGMREVGHGSVIYVSSRSGIVGFANETAYCAGKHGIEGLMKSLSEEGKAANIAVNTVTPGMYMHTPMSERNYSEELKQKWVDPIRLTPAFVLLAEQNASGITGQRLSAWELSEQIRAGER